MPHEHPRTDRDVVVGVGCPGAACCGPIYKADGVTYGAWDEPKEVDPNHKHNWLYTHVSDEYVCVRCGLREDAVMHRWVESK